MPSPKNLTNVEVLGPQKRRRWSPQEKLAMVQQSYEPGYSVSLVARQHGVNANQLFLWRKQHQQGELTPVAVGESTVPAAQLADAMRQIRELSACWARRPWRPRSSRKPRNMAAQKTGLRARPCCRGTPNETGL